MINVEYNELFLKDLKKLKNELGWEPKVTLQELVSMMVKADLEDAQRELHLKNGGYAVKNYYE